FLDTRPSGLLDIPIYSGELPRLKETGLLKSHRSDENWTQVQYWDLPLLIASVTEFPPPTD
ncbi:MAG: hypothetical protein PUP92_09790, partial [Rhizonema sp. PD38]|nr:hypothetical protein [Rhizonema sp. PD38]